MSTVGSKTSRERPNIRHSLILSTILFIASRAVIFAYFAGHWSETALYEQYGRRLLSGDVPYRDFFPEYPPLALAFMALPALVTKTHYAAVYHFLCFLIDLAIWSYFSRTRQWPLYLLATTALGPLIYDRFDIGLAALLLWATVAIKHGRHGHLAVGLGIAFKLIPVVLAPFLLARNPRPRTALLLFAPTIISFGLVACAGGYRLDKMLAYHLHRGTQIESIPASIQMGLMQLGVQGTAYQAHACDNVVTAWDQPINAICQALMMSVLFGAAYVAIRHRIDDDVAALWLAAILSASLALSRVLSTQYFIFLLGVVPSIQRPLLLSGIFCLTGAIFPWLYSDLRILNRGAELVLLSRNLLLVILSVQLVRAAWRRSARRCER